MPRTYFRRNYRSNQEQNPVLDLIGFASTNRTGDENSVRNTRQTMIRCMDKLNVGIDDISKLMGTEVSIATPSMAANKEAVIAALRAVSNGRSQKAVADAITLIRSPQVQELHLLPFDAEVDGEYSYKANDEAIEYHVVARRGYLDPKTGRPSTPGNGQICKVLISVGDDPRNAYSNGNSGRPSPAQERHQTWRKHVAAEGLATTALSVNTFRIVGVNHILERTGSRTESELVFYVEGYSFWNDGDSKMLVQMPSGNGQAPAAQDMGDDGMDFAQDAWSGDTDGDPLG